MKGFKQVLHSVTEEEVDASFETLATILQGIQIS